MKATRQQLEELIDAAYKNAIAHGWHNEPVSVDHCKCLIVSELMEAVEADRKSRRADYAAFDKELLTDIREFHLVQAMVTNERDKLFEKYVKDTLDDELADAFIRTLDLAGYLDKEVELINVGPSRLPFTEAIFSIVRTIAKTIDNQRMLNMTASKIAALSEECGVDLQTAIKAKMDYNKNRPYKHNKKY